MGRNKHKAKEVAAGAPLSGEWLRFSFPATFAITAEAPLGDQAGIDSNQAMNSPNPDNGTRKGGKPGKPPLPKFALSI